MAVRGEEFTLEVVNALAVLAIRARMAAVFMVLFFVFFHRLVDLAPLHHRQALVVAPAAELALRAPAHHAWATPLRASVALDAGLLRVRVLHRLAAPGLLFVEELILLSPQSFLVLLHALVDAAQGLHVLSARAALLIEVGRKHGERGVELTVLA